MFANAMTARIGKDTCCFEKRGNLGVWQLEAELDR